MFSSALDRINYNRIDFDRIDFEKIDYDRIDFERIDLCLDTIMQNWLNKLNVLIKFAFEYIITKMDITKYK